MEFGFIQGAVPALSPVPLVEPSISADGSGDAAAAFDAALAATLGKTGGQAPAAAVAGATIAQPAWLFTQFLMPTATSFDVADAPATIAGELAPEEEPSVPAEAASDEESVNGLDALAAEVVVPVPVMAQVSRPVVPQGGPVAEDAIGNTVGQAPPAPMTQPREQAHHDGAAPREQAHHDGAAPRVPDAGVDGHTDVPAHQTVAHTPKVPVAAAAGAAGPGIGDSTGAPVEQPVPADAPTDSAAARREMPVMATVQMSRSDRAHQGAPPPETVRPAAVPTVAEATPSNAAAATADAGQAVPVTNAASTPSPASAPRTEPAESGVAARTPMSWHTQSGHDAPMTGQDSHQQGQGRPSPEFTRFAAALAQVASAGVEDGGRQAGSVTAPVASAAAPSAAPAPAAGTAAAAAPQSAPDTPEAESLGRLVQAMRVISRPGAWEANVRLKPEHLGDVNIAVRVERNTVSAVVNAEAAGVRQWLESQEQAVRSGMAEHGLHLERFVVQRDGQRREPQHQQESPRHRGRRPASTTERFEIVV